jgi:hypothetical protein
MAEHDKAVRRVPGDVRKEVKAEVRVIRLPIERLGEAADLFARSFHTNPNFMDLGVSSGCRRERERAWRPDSFAPCRAWLA